MTQFSYEAISADGQRRLGQVDAESRLVALDHLASQGLCPVSVHETRESTGRARRLRHRELASFSRQLADLLEAGISVPRALDLVRQQSGENTLKTGAEQLLMAIHQGLPLSEAMSLHPEIFSPFYVTVIAAGEAGGTLDAALSRLAEFAEQEAEWRSRVQAALAYPLLILTVGILTVIFLMSFAVPRLANVFSDMGQVTPFPTRALLFLSHLIVHDGWTLLPAGIILFFLLRTSGWRNDLSQHIRRWVPRLPIWGPLIQKSAVARLARTLAMLLSGGVPIVEALKVSSSVIDGSWFGKEMARTSRRVAEGESLSNSLKDIPGIPLTLCHMIAVGEEVNALEKSLNKVASGYERETDRAMKVASSLLEPLMILAIGSVVGMVVMAMLLPIFEISATVK